MTGNPPPRFIRTLFGNSPTKFFGACELKQPFEVTTNRDTCQVELVNSRTLSIPYRPTSKYTRVMAFISSAGLTTSFRARALPAASTCSTAKQGALTMSDGTVSTSVTRRAFLSSVGAMALWCASGVNAEGAPVQVEEVTPGKGVVPVIGDLVGIRFRGSFNGVVFDNLFDSKEPYFYRVGSTNVLPVC